MGKFHGLVLSKLLGVSNMDLWLYAVSIWRAISVWMPGVDIVMFVIEGWGLGPLSGRGPGVFFREH